MLWRSVVEKCWREVLERSVDKKCRQMLSYLSMTFSATFAYLLPGHPTLSTTLDYFEQRKKTAQKIDTNAQWFHCSWSILLKRVNIRFGFVVSILFFLNYSEKFGKSVFSLPSLLRLKKKGFILTSKFKRHSCQSRRNHLYPSDS